MAIRGTLEQIREANRPRFYTREELLDDLEKTWPKGAISGHFFGVKSNEHIPTFDGNYCSICNTPIRPYIPENVFVEFGGLRQWAMDQKLWFRAWPYWYGPVVLGVETGHSDEDE